MKVRSASELQDNLNKELKSRKRELTTLRFQIDRAKRDHERKLLLRASLPILYAHWEGFVKIAATAYVTYVSGQRVSLRNLKHNFLALACRSQFLTAFESKKSSQHTKAIEFLFEHLDRTVPLASDNAIDTGSNLSSEVFKEILQTIGLDASDWQKKAPLIDHKLLRHRNEIAHGEMIEVDDTTFRELHEFVVSSLDRLKNQIENAVALESYKLAVGSAVKG